jgi:hypothetical protein
MQKVSPARLRVHVSICRSGVGCQKVNRRIGRLGVKLVVAWGFR